MHARSTRSTLTFSSQFTLPGYPGALSAGEYEVLAEEEPLQGFKCGEYRRLATYLTECGNGARAGQVVLLTTTEDDLKQAQCLDAATFEIHNRSDAALSPQEDRK